MRLRIATAWLLDSWVTVPADTVPADADWAITGVADRGTDIFAVAGVTAEPRARAKPRAIETGLVMFTVEVSRIDSKAERTSDKLVRGAIKLQLIYRNLSEIPYKFTPDLIISMAFDEV